MNQQQGKQSLGLQQKMLNMDPKKKKLFTQMISVMLIFSIVYAFLSFVFTFQRTGSLTAWFAGQDFVLIVVLMVFAGLGSKILQGGEIKVPDQFKKNQGQQKQQFNIPNTWGVPSLKTHPQAQTQQPPLQHKPITRPQPLGAWQCPNCSEFTVGTQCRHCGYVRQ